MPRYVIDAQEETEKAFRPITNVPSALGSVKPVVALSRCVEHGDGKAGVGHAAIQRINGMDVHRDLFADFWLPHYVTTHRR